MKHLSFILLVVGVLITCSCFGQTYQRIRLTKKNVKKALNHVSYQTSVSPLGYSPYFRKASDYSELVADNGDSSYFKSDTIRLYTPRFEDSKWCRVITWHIQSPMILYLTQDKTCGHPSYKSDWNIFNIRFVRKQCELNMRIYNHTQLTETFQLLSLDRIDINDEDWGLQRGYRLIMVRR